METLPITPDIVNIAFRDTSHILIVAANAKKTTTVNKMNDRNKMPTAHSGTFARLNTRTTASQAIEPEFLPTHHKDIR